MLHFIAGGAFRPAAWGTNNSLATAARNSVGYEACPQSCINIQTAHARNWAITATLLRAGAKWSEGKAFCSNFSAGRRGDRCTAGDSNRPGLVWILVGAVTLQSNKSGRAVGSTGQMCTEGEAVPKRATPK